MVNKEEEQQSQQREQSTVAPSQAKRPFQDEGEEAAPALTRSTAIAVESPEAIVGDIDHATKKARTEAEDLIPTANINEDIVSSLNTTSGDNKRDVTDLAQSLGYKAGDRFEVQWDIEDDSNEDDGVVDVHTHWWPATLLEYDGRVDGSVAVRVLDYDPYPEGGFPNRSSEDVIFTDNMTIINPITHDELTYRIYGTTSAASPSDTEDNINVLAPDDDIWLEENQIEEVINHILANTLEKNAQAWSKLSHAQQSAIADNVATKKAQLVESLRRYAGTNRVIGETEMLAIFSEIMNK